MSIELARVIRQTELHTSPELLSPEGMSLGPGVLVEVVERNGPALAVLVKECNGDREGWVGFNCLTPAPKTAWERL